MFSNCKNLNNLNISSFTFKSPYLRDSSYMFNNCTSLTSLDFSNFITSQVTTMEKMFYSCKVWMSWI